LGEQKRPKFGAISRTSEFDREYRRKGWKYRESEKQVINYNPSHADELWSTNKKLKARMLTHPKSIIWPLWGAAR